MALGPPPPDDALRAEIARAFQELRPDLIEFARRDADLDPHSRLDEFSPQEVEQFLNAWEAIFTEALDGTSRSTRDFVLETALPPVLELGQTSLDMAQSNMISAVMLTSRLLPLITEERREQAARWLAAFYAEYTREIVERAQALEGERA